MPSRIRPILILGPTAGGKSELAVSLAEQLNGEVIGADSMQVYRGLDAGTAKPSAELRARASHHLIDTVEPTKPFTVADWLALADNLITSRQGAGKRPIVVGGTNLYIRALLEGMFDGPPADDAFRASLADLSGPELHRRLAVIDPHAAGRIHTNDLKRLIRALEVHHLTGKPLSEWQQQWRDGPAVHTSEYRFNPVLIGLHWPTEVINRRINARVRPMFFPTDAGIESLPDEIRRLEAAGKLGDQARQALGYRQTLDHLAGRCTLDEAFEQTKIQTRRFAKTQRTWLRRFRGVHWIEAGDLTAPEISDLALQIVTEC